MIKSRKIALIYRSAALIIAAAGLLDLLGVFGGAFYYNILYFYTAQSNIMAIIMFILLTFRTIGGIGKETDNSVCYFPRFVMVCSINTLLTLIVFWVLLVPQLAGVFPLWTFSNLAVHAITPLLCLFDYILFSEPRRLKYKDAYNVLIFPLCYLAAASVAGLMGLEYGLSSTDGAPIRFPYFFFDYDRIGALSIAYIAGLVVFFLIIGHVFYYVDSKLRKPSS